MDAPFVIGICGKARSGKDTTANMIVSSHVLSQCYVMGFRLSLADPIKNIIGGLLSLWLNDPAAGVDADVVIERMLNGNLKEAPIPDLGDMSPRRMMQTLGTEWGRNRVCEDLWVKLLRGRINFVSRQAENAGANGCLVVVPDVRFDNEAKLCDVLLQLDRPDVEMVAKHESEEGISTHLITHTIHNTGSTDVLQEKVNTFVREVLNAHFAE